MQNRNRSPCRVHREIWSRFLFCIYAYLVGHHKCRIETDSKFPDELCKGFRRVQFLDALSELLCSRSRNGPQILNELMATHADPSVSNSQTPASNLRRDPNLVLVIILDQSGNGQRFEM